MDSKILKFLFVLGLLFVFYSVRWIFVNKFEPEYWENYYYESQWNVANSKRVIGDGGVYTYIGYRLVNGENPFNVDYWVPPLGKFWYGVGAKFLGNEYWICVLVYGLSMLAFWKLTGMVIREKDRRIWAMFLVGFNPLIVEQIFRAMLDLPMTLFWILNLFFLLGDWPKKMETRAVCAGLMLGLMAGVKPAYYVPMLALVNLWWLAKTNRKSWVYFIPSIVAGYLLAYSCYFLRHPNPIPFIRLHDKIIAFQRNNAGSHDVVSILRTIFIGRYRGFWVGAHEWWLTTWTALLPIGTMISWWVLRKWREKNRGAQIMFCLAIISLAYIGMNMVVDFWPRYMVPLVPMFGLLVVNSWPEKKKQLLAVLLVSYIPFLWMTLYPSDKELRDNFCYQIDNGFYRDSYRMLDSKSRDKISEERWKIESKMIKPEKVRTVKEYNQWRVALD